MMNRPLRHTGIRVFALALIALMLTASVPAFAGPNAVTVVSAAEATAAKANAKALGHESVTITPKDFCANSDDKFMLQPVEVNLRNGRTTASFDVPRTGNLTVKLYDRLGREVQEIQNGEMNAGRHTFIFREYRIPISTFYLGIEYKDSNEHVDQRVFL